MGNGVRNSGLLSTILIFCAGLGCLGIRRVIAKVPFFLASFFLTSLFFTRSKKSVRRLEWLMCSIRTLILLGRILPLMRLFTMTPTASMVAFVGHTFLESSITL